MSSKFNKEDGADKEVYEKINLLKEAYENPFEKFF